MDHRGQVDLAFPVAHQLRHPRIKRRVLALEPRGFPLRYSVDLQRVPAMSECQGTLCRLDLDIPDIAALLATAR